MGRACDPQRRHSGTPTDISEGRNWQIPSSSGREVITGSLNDVQPGADDWLLVFQVTYTRTRSARMPAGTLVAITTSRSKIWARVPSRAANGAVTIF
jgi:hypothetical protein